MSFAEFFLNTCKEAIDGFEHESIEQAVMTLRQVRQDSGRLFVAGSGGGAGHASHAVCDFRKLCNIDAYAPYDNISELTARVNDDGWESSLSNTLKVSRMNERDALLLFSVGGGDEERNISANLVSAAKYAKSRGAKVIAIVGRDGGYLGKNADVAIIIPPVNGDLVTPITEGFQAVIWHLLVSHPMLAMNAAKWESEVAQSTGTAKKNHNENGNGNGKNQSGELNTNPITNNSAAQLLEKFNQTVTATQQAQAPTAKDLRIKIYADGANLDDMRARNQDPLIHGFTTNPTLMRKSGVSDYEQFAKAALEMIPNKPISFEVFSDDFDEMERQALQIASWGNNVYVKVPITNSKSESSLPLIERLVAQNVRLNVTAITTFEQAQPVIEILKNGPASIVSIFAGRIADTGRDPVETVTQVLEAARPYWHIEVLWASPREIYNLIQANNIGCHIITVTEDILKKLPSLNMDLLKMSLDTVAMFHRDAQASGYTIAYDKSEEKVTAEV